MTQKIFSPETQQRMDALKQLLKNYEKDIERLNQVAKGQFTLKGKGYTDNVEHYVRTPADEQRHRWTIQNLKAQIQFYQHELEVLHTYGR